MSLARFQRLQLLYPNDGLKRLQDKSVAVFGIGGVGSYAVEALVRGGIGKLTLVDFDQVDITNLNRQVHAIETTVGQPKVVAMAERCWAINPDIKIEPIAEKFTAASEESLLNSGYDYVLDCIDLVTSKLHLLESCLQRKIPVISSMGAANKVDATLVEVADLAETHKCRLARIIRKELRKRGIENGVKVVYSIEEFRPLSDGRQSIDVDGNYQQRRAPLGSSSFIPPIFGLTMAGEVIRDLLGER